MSAAHGVGPVNTSPLLLAKACSVPRHVLPLHFTTLGALQFQVRREQDFGAHYCKLQFRTSSVLLLAVLRAAWRRGWRRPSATARWAAAAASTSGECPELSSECSVDYSTLRDLLAAGDFKAADAETRRLLITLGGKEAEKRGWVYFAEVRSIPEVDLVTVDSLWQHFSHGKFGFVPQRKIWRQSREQFDKFALSVSWFTDKWKNRNWPDDFIYSLDAPEGHLPLTNCIRGAQVLQELMNHPAFDQKKQKSKAVSKAPPKEDASGQRSPVSLLAVGGVHRHCAGQRTTASFAGTSLQRRGVHGAAARERAAVRGVAMRAAAAAAAAAAAGESTSVADAAPTVTTALADLEAFSVINEVGFVLPDVPEGTKASAFVIFDSQKKAQYLGFSKDLRNTLRTFLCRRPEKCYLYKCAHFAMSDNAPLLELRAAWVSELGGLPGGNKDPREKSQWENPVDGGAVSERAYQTVAEQKAKQVLRQLLDRGLKEKIEFSADLIKQGKVDCVPSQLSVKDLRAQTGELGNRTAHVEQMVMGKKIEFDMFYSAEFVTKGGWWFDVEITANKQKSSHRIIVGKDFVAAVDAKDPKVVVENAFAMLLAKKVARKTEGIITSDVFPVNYFTAANVATWFPEFLELFGRRQEEFNWDAAQWNFKQVHDYSQDDKRTIPAGPNGGFFDPAALT